MNNELDLEVSLNTRLQIYYLRAPEFLLNHSTK